MRFFIGQSSTALAFVLLSSALAVIAMIYLTRRGSPELSRQSANALLIGMLFWLCLEYMMGPYSTLFWGDEGNSVPPVLNYTATFSEPGQLFAHEFGGGVDRFSMSLAGSTYISLDMTLARILPMWAVIMANKLVSVALGLIGMYLLCRKTANLPRFLSVVAAGLYFAIDRHHINITMIYGPAWGSFPMVAFLTAFLLGRSRRAFFISLFGLAALSGLVPPTHIGIGAGATFVIAVACFYRGPVWRPVVAAAVIPAAIIANWHEVLWAFLQVSGETTKLSSGSNWITTLTGIPISEVLVVSILAIGVLVLCRDRFAYPGGAAIAGCLFLLPVVHLILSILPGMEVLLSARWPHIRDALDVFGLLVIARAADRLQYEIAGNPILKRYLNTSALMLGYFVFFTTLIKGDHLFELVHKGGYSHFTSIENLKVRDWEEPGLHRVVTLRGQDAETNIAPGFYGLDAFDCQLNLVPRSVMEYWNHGIYKKFTPGGLTFPIMGLNPKFWSWEDLEYDLNASVRISFLRAVNVQYVLSRVPIKEKGLTLVSAPDEPRSTFGLHRNWDDRLRYYERRLRIIAVAGNMYVYRLEDAVPRAFGAEAVNVAPADEGVGDAVKGGAEAALARRARIAGSNAKYFESFRGNVHVRDVAKTKYGYMVQLDAARNGAVVLNVPFSSFWRARVDGIDRKVVPVNVVQMAVSVPQGTKKVAFIYDRPMLKDVLAERIFGAKKL